MIHCSAGLGLHGLCFATLLARSVLGLSGPDALAGGAINRRRCSTPAQIMLIME